MKIRSLCLLLIFCVSLVPINPVQAKVGAGKSVYDSIALMYFSDAVLLGETELEEAVLSPGFLAPAANNLSDEPDNASLAAALHSLKAMRNDLDATCNLLVTNFRGLGKDCEAERIISKCAQKKQEINSEIGKFHDLRGDRRRGPTRIWHWLKRSGRGFWYRIGPVGRNFLRQVGPEALKIVVSGGSLSLDVAKNLLKHTAKSMLRDRIRPAMLHGIRRLMQGQIEIAQAAGVDICDPEGEKLTSKSEEAAENGQITGKRTWECEDIQGRIWGLRQQEGDDMKTLKEELDFQIIYDGSEKTVDIFHYLDVVQEWAILQTDGSYGEWHEITTEMSLEGQVNVAADNGYFETTLKGEEFRGNTLPHISEVTLSATSNIFGLINPEDISIVYICDVGAKKLPSFNESISADNFRDLCIGYYYECKLPSK